MACEERVASGLWGLPSPGVECALYCCSMSSTWEIPLDPKQGISGSVHARCPWRPQRGYACKGSAGELACTPWHPSHVTAGMITCRAAGSMGLLPGEAYPPWTSPVVDRLLKLTHTGEGELGNQRGWIFSQPAQRPAFGTLVIQGGA